MKKFINQIAFLLFLFVASSTSLCAQEEPAIHEWTDSQGITWSFYVETIGEAEEETSFAVINASTTCTGKVVVPSEVTVGETTYPVKRIERAADKSIFGTEVTEIDFGSVEELRGDYSSCFGCVNIHEIHADSLTGIPDGFFFDTPVQFVYLSEKCKYIGTNAFGGTKNLEHIGDLSGVTTICEGAFYGSRLPEISLPACTHIGKNAFAGCSNLNSMTLSSTIPVFDKDEETGDDLNPFIGTNTNLVKLIVPGDQLEAYKSANIWQNFNYSDEQIYRQLIGETYWAYTLNADQTEATIWGTTTITDGTALEVPETVTYEVRNGDDFEYIPVPVTSIASRAFAGYSDLTRIILPSKLTSIGKDAFAGDEQLKYVTINNAESVLNVVEGSISEWMKGSTTFKIPQNLLEAYRSNSNWDNLQFFVESEQMTWTDPKTGITWTFATNTFDDAITNGYIATVYGSTECPEAVSVPQNMYIDDKPYAVKYLEKRDGFRLFGDNTKIVHLEDVEEIHADWSGFLGNPQVEYVNAPSLKSIGAAVFRETNLKEIVLTENCKSIGSRALEGTQIKSINLTGCESLSSFALGSCFNLTDVYIGEVIRNFDGETDENGQLLCSPFDNMNTGSITLHLPENADAALYKSADIWGGFHYLDQGGQLYTCTINNREWVYAINADSETATVYGTHESLASYPSSIMVIDAIVHEGELYPVTAIGEGAFAHCSNLHFLGIPASVTSVGKDAIYADDQLNHIFIYNEESVVDIPEDMFEGIPTSDLFLILPASMTDAYAAHSTWNQLKIYTGFKYDHSVSFDYTDANGVTWTVEPMYPIEPNNPDPEYPLAWDHENSLWYTGMEDKVQIIDMKNYTKNVVVPETVKINNQTYYVRHINGDNSNAPEVIEGREPFAGKNDIETIQLPPSVKTLGWGAFRGNSSLTSINLEYLEGINDGSFGECDKLTNLDLSNVKGVGAGAFIDLKALTTVKLTDQCVEIADAAFSGCENLTAVGDVSSVEALGREAFKGTASLKSLNFTTALKQIGNQAFEDSGIETVGSTAGVVSMGWGAFRNSKIKSVDLSNCALLDEWVFDSCNDLEEVGSVAHLLGLGHGVFWDCISLKSLDLSNKCAYLGHRAVAGCTSLTEVGDLTGLEYIESFAFDGDQSLTTLDIPKASHIGENAFLNCSATVNYVNGNKFVPENDPDYSLYVDDVNISDATLTIPFKLRLKEGSNVCAFQSDIILPTGCSASSFGANPARIDVNKATPMFSHGTGEGGRWRTTGVSFPNIPFVGDDGVIATLVIDMNGVKQGDYEPSLTNVVLATADGHAIYVGGNSFTFDIAQDIVATGDINGDGKTTIADAVLLINIVLGNTKPAEEIDLRVCDMNKDGQVNIADAIAIIDALLNVE